MHVALREPDTGPHTRMEMCEVNSCHIKEGARGYAPLVLSSLQHFQMAPCFYLYLFKCLVPVAIFSTASEVPTCTEKGSLPLRTFCPSQRTGTLYFLTHCSIPHEAVPFIQETICSVPCVRHTLSLRETHRVANGCHLACTHSGR